MKRGEGCPICGEGRPAETPHGIRFFAGDVTDAYLHRGGIQRGLSHVYFRGRHVVEPTELDERESATFWRELLIVGAAIERVFEPVKLNYQVLGNSVPHLHVHLIPRYAVDPRPGWPFPFPEPDPPPFPDEEVRADAARLRAAVDHAVPIRASEGNPGSEREPTSLP